MYNAIATSHLDSLLMSSVKGTSELNQQQEKVMPDYMESSKYIQFIKQGLKTAV
jgi:hypothetical protein